jgi:hypothetical protein
MRWAFQTLKYFNKIKELSLILNYRDYHENKVLVECYLDASWADTCAIKPPWGISYLLITALFNVPLT